NYTKLKSYTTKFGTVINVGDTLTLGKAKKNKEKYIFDDTYSFVVNGKRRGNKQDDYEFLPHHYSGDKVVVLSIFATHATSDEYKLWNSRKSQPLYISLYVKNPSKGSGSGKFLSTIANSSFRTVIDIDKALEFNEIFNENMPLSRAEAIAKLKEHKDLYDLGLISEKEYNILKEKLTPIIMKK
ncbi:SHOCT domain-containing protein, partial [bacterium]|nr:SHOCT domain-containing protein [bacterium]